MALDLRTVLVANMYIFAICTGAVAALAAMAKGKVEGTSFWVADFACQSAALLLVALRGLIPDALSIVLGNGLAVGGAILGYVGFARFVGARPRLLPNLALLAVFLGVHAWFALVEPNLTARNVNASLALGLVCGESAYVLIRARGRPFARLAGLANLGYLVVGLARVARYADAPLGTQDYLHSTQFEVLVQILYQVLFLLLTASISLMVNGLLAERAESERSKFATTFRSAPVPFMLSRLGDGRILDVNDAFEALFGHRREEAVGRTTLDIAIWDSAEVRNAMVAELDREGRISPREALLRDKAGGPLTGILAIERVEAEGQSFLVSSFSDISERTRMEGEVRALLAEKELILKEVHHRVKNNFAAVIALLDLEAGRAEAGTRAAAVLGVAAERLRAMSLLYEKLYKAERYDSLSLAEFLGPLAREIVAAFPGADATVLELSLDERRLPPSTLAGLGLVVNELLTNSLKYAFPGGGPARLRVASSGEGARIRLEVGDAGRGLPPAAAARLGAPWSDAGGPDPEKPGDQASGGFGLELVQVLVAQLGGRLRLEPGPGTRFTIQFEAG